MGITKGVPGEKPRGMAVGSISNNPLAAVSDRLTTDDISINIDNITIDIFLCFIPLSPK
jgi:hypothetical protein